MTKPLEALISDMKSAANEATPGQWVAFSDENSETYAIHTPNDDRCGNVINWPGFEGREDAAFNADFIALANPANVLALIAALDQSQQEISRLNEKYENRTPTEWAYNQACEALQHHKDRIVELEAERRMSIKALVDAGKRIAELENDEVRQRLANAEHQLHMAELAKHNLLASRRAQFNKRMAAENRIAELDASRLAVKLVPHKYRECVDGLLEEAIAYAGTQQLRSRLSSRLSNFVKPDHAAGGTVQGDEL